MKGATLFPGSAEGLDYSRVQQRNCLMILGVVKIPLKSVEGVHSSPASLFLLFQLVTAYPVQTSSPTTNTSEIHSVTMELVGTFQDTL